MTTGVKTMLISLNNPEVGFDLESSAAKIFSGSLLISYSVFSQPSPTASATADGACLGAVILSRMPDHQCMMRGWFGRVSRYAVPYDWCVFVKHAGLHASKPNHLCCVFLDSYMSRASCVSDVFGARSWSIVCVCWCFWWFSFSSFFNKMNRKWR